MRKYDKRNKMYFMMVIGLSIVLIIIFSFFLNKVITNGKLNYVIDAASIMYDKDKNLIRIDEESTLKKKWNDIYYLNYKDELINLGLNAIIYNPSKSQMNLYGRFYEISKDMEDKVIIHDNETLVGVNESKFYKIADRKYLLIDKTIKGENNEINASNYLIVELDKLGNAILYNNNLNMKTFKETKLITSTYVFNIAEEILTINDEEVDLKKIIGSSNKYVKAEDIDKKDNNNDNNKTNNNVNRTTNNNVVPNNNNNQNTNNQNTNNQNTNNKTNNTIPNTDNDNSNNNNSTNPSVIDDDTIEDIIKATKTTTIIAVTPSVGYINIDYVIYDPLEEYEAVFVEIYDDTNNLVAVTYFDKTSQKLVIPNLRANARYNLIFKYSYYDDNKQRIEEKFDEASVMMSSPNLSVKITKVTSNKIYYTVYLDNDYELDSLKVNIKDNNNYTSSKNITKQDINKQNTYTNYFEYNEIGKYITVYLSNVIYKGNSVNINANYKIVMP